MALAACLKNGAVRWSHTSGKRVEVMPSVVVCTDSRVETEPDPITGALVRPMTQLTVRSKAVHYHWGVDAYAIRNLERLNGALHGRAYELGSQDVAERFARSKPARAAVASAAKGRRAALAFFTDGEVPLEHGLGFSLEGTDRDVYDDLNSDDLFFEMDEVRTSLTSRYSLLRGLAADLVEQADDGLETFISAEASYASDGRRFSVRDAPLSDGFSLDRLPHRLSETAWLTEDAGETPELAAVTVALRDSGGADCGSLCVAFVVAASACAMAVRATLVGTDAARATPVGAEAGGSVPEPAGDHSCVASVGLSAELFGECDFVAATALVAHTSRTCVPVDDVAGLVFADGGWRSRARPSAAEARPQAEEPKPEAETSAREVLAPMQSADLPDAEPTALPIMDDEGAARLAGASEEFVLELAAEFTEACDGNKQEDGVDIGGGDEHEGGSEVGDDEPVLRCEGAEENEPALGCGSAEKTRPVLGSGSDEESVFEPFVEARDATVPSSPAESGESIAPSPSRCCGVALREMVLSPLEVAEAFPSTSSPPEHHVGKLFELFLSPSGPDVERTVVLTPPVCGVPDEEMHAPIPSPVGSCDEDGFRGSLLGHSPRVAIELSPEGSEARGVPDREWPISGLVEVGKGVFMAPPPGFEAFEMRRIATVAVNGGSRGEILLKLEDCVQKTHLCAPLVEDGEGGGARLAAEGGSERADAPVGAEDEEADAPVGAEDEEADAPVGAEDEEADEAAGANFESVELAAVEGARAQSLSDAGGSVPDPTSGRSNPFGNAAPLRYPWGPGSSDQNLSTFYPVVFGLWEGSADMLSSPRPIVYGGQTKTLLALSAPPSALAETVAEGPRATRVWVAQAVRFSTRVLVTCVASLFAGLGF